MLGPTWNGNTCNDYGNTNNFIVDRTTPSKQQSRRQSVNISDVGEINPKQQIVQNSESDIGKIKQDRQLTSTRNHVVNDINQDNKEREKLQNLIC
mgnify:FL=1